MTSPSGFFERPADEVAPSLLGALLTHDGVTLRITEVEAYLGEADPASHAARGQHPGGANAALFGPPGCMYVYHSYGIHRAGNIVSHPLGGSGGVLLRAGEVVAGLDIARQRRGDLPAERLASGPGNLGKTLDLQISDNFAPVALDNTGKEAFELHLPIVRPEITCGPRIGISRNVEAPLRFWIPFDKTVSRRRGLGAAL